MGVVALALEASSFWIFGWLSVVGLALGITLVGLALGIIGVVQPTETIGKKVPAIIAIPVGVVLAILWMIALSSLR